MLEAPLAALAAAALSFAAADPAVGALPQDPADPTRALYLEHCAKCHGERGDGQGTTALDRPARSFLAGGFSYGNTRGAIVRSIRHGIPGTPMPAFPDEVLTAAQRDALADFVIGFGPPGTVVEPGASVLRVEDRPLVVRGMLPPLAEGDARVPRGLLIGFPSGTTFEYRVDDVRFRALRQGEFVDRKDWGDRGGVPLAPLGVVISDARAAATPFRSVRGEELACALRGTDVVGQEVVLRAAVVDADGNALADVRERLLVLDTEVGPVPVRALELTPRAGAPAGVVLPDPPAGARLDGAFLGVDGALRHVHRVADGAFRVASRAADGEPRALVHVHAPRWSAALERALATLEVAR